MFRANLVVEVKTLILCVITFSPENLAVYEMMWKSMVEPGGPRTTIWRVLIACWITKLHTLTQNM